MKTGLSKKQKATNIYFTEADTMIEVCTYNTSLKNRLTDYAGNYPSECRLIDNDGNGCLTFEVNKGRFGFKLTAPYSEESRKAASVDFSRYEDGIRQLLNTYVKDNQANTGSCRADQYVFELLCCRG